MRELKLPRMIYYPGVALSLGVVSRSPERCILVFYPTGIPVPVLIHDKLLLSFLCAAVPFFCGSSLSFSQDEANSSPPLPGALSTHYGVPENNSLLGGKAGPLTKEKPKRNGGRGLEDLRPSVENLLDELESSVPSPV